MAMRVLVLGMAVILLGCPEERGVDPDPVESTEQDSGVLEDSTDSSFVEDQSEPEPGCQDGDGDRFERGARRVRTVTTVMLSCTRNGLPGWMAMGMGTQ